MRFSQLHRNYRSLIPQRRQMRAFSNVSRKQVLASPPFLQCNKRPEGISHETSLICCQKNNVVKFLFPPYHTPSLFPHTHAAAQGVISQGTLSLSLPLRHLILSSLLLSFLVPFSIVAYWFKIVWNFLLPKRFLMSCKHTR